MIHKLQDNKILLIDKKDSWILKEYSFHVNQQGYAVTEIGNRKNNTRKVLRLHRMLLQPKENEIVDHVNRNKLDNRRSNLRIADKSKNGMNRTAQSNSKTKIKGVCWSKQKNKYRIYCNVRGRQYHLGYANTLELAKDIYKQKIKKYHKEFSCV